MTVEEWRPVVGYEGWYEVSSIGRLKRIAPGTRGCGLLNPAKDNYGYPQAYLSKGDGARDGRRRYRVHRLVAAAFLGECPPGFTVNHKDGEKANNALENLEYVPHRENLVHAGLTGLMAHGERNGQAVLTEAIVREIRERAKDTPRAELCRMFGIGAGHVSLIVNRRIWKRVA